MIQPQELRIGNYYQGASRGNIETVTWQTLRDLSEGKLNLLTIPLTEEILLKFGFEKSIVKYWFEKESFIIDLSNRLVFYRTDRIIRDKGFLHLKFVHQLQNIYFALTGEELTFKK